MSLAWTLEDGTCVRAAWPPLTLAHRRFSAPQVGADDSAPRPVGVGDLIALPILADTDGRPVDLIELAAGRPVVLMVAGQTAQRACAEALPAIEAAGGMLMVVSSDPPALGPDGRAASSPPLFVDAGDRFAQTLGLVAAPASAARSGARPLGATYVLAPCGRVTWAHIEAAAGGRPDPAAVVEALERLATLAADVPPAAAWESLR